MKQLEAIDLLYLQGLTAAEAGHLLGVSKQAICDRMNSLANKAPEVYRWWRQVMGQSSGRRLTSLTSFHASPRTGHRVAGLSRDVSTSSLVWRAQATTAMTLHPVLGRNRYCGPAALAALTGTTTDEIAALLRQQTGRRAIRGVDVANMLAALHRLGVATVLVYDAAQLRRRSALQDWAKKATIGPCLVEVTGHWCVFNRGEVVDNMTIYPVEIDRYRRRSRRVRRAWLITAPCSTEGRPVTSGVPNSTAKS